MMKYLIAILLVIVPFANAQFCNNSAVDCNLNGFCIDNQCRCFTNYVTHNSATGCNYHQKDRTTAFLLEFFLGEFGAGWFYLGRNEFAVPVLVLTLVLACCFKPILVIASNNDNAVVDRQVSACFAVLSGCAVFGLWLHGMIVTGDGSATDSNGVTVGEW